MLNKQIQRKIELQNYKNHCIGKIGSIELCPTLYRGWLVEGGQGREGLKVRVGLTKTGGKNIPDLGNSMCKVSEAGNSLASYKPYY